MEKFRATLPYIAILVIVIIIRSFIVSPVIVVGPSMNNTLKNGNVLLLNKMYYEFNEIKRFDVVVIKTTSHPIIKRVIALPNEEVYLEKGKLKVSILDRGTAWLDTGTFQSLMQAGQFVQVIEERQGLKIGAIEEAAYKMNFIDGAQLEKLAQPLLKSGYGTHLMSLIKK